MFHIKKIATTNFRGIGQLEIDFNKKLNIFVGNNGAGKTSLLDCISIMLSRLIGRIRTTKGTGRFFSDNDISNWNNELYVDIDIVFDGINVGWRVTKTRSGRKKQKITQLSELNKIVENIHELLGKDEKYNIPLAVYYNVNRSVLDIPLRIRTHHEFNQLAAYDQALSGDRGAFRVFFEWFRNREDIENEHRVENKQYRDVQLEAVRSAISSFMPGFSELKVKRTPLRMVVHKNRNELIVNQLSDGEKCLLALVGDLARRLAIANPSNSKPLSGNAVVLIDEVDLHLHPEWQQDIMRRFSNTFPNCQFIVTTHSPLIINHVMPESVYVLNRIGRDVVACSPSLTYGKSADRVIEDVLNVSSRPVLVKKYIDKIYKLINDKDFLKAKRHIDLVKKQIGEDPELTRASVLLKRVELMGK